MDRRFKVCSVAFRPRWLQRSTRSISPNRHARDWLLSDTFSREISDSKRIASPRPVCESYSRCSQHAPIVREHVDGRRIEELVRRRDSIATEIEQQLARRRTESEILEREIKEIEVALNTKRGQLEPLRAKLQRLDAEIAGLEARLRYHSLDDYVRCQGQPLDLEAQERELAALDDEIALCRQNLAESQRREQQLRAELAQFGSDGTADRVTCLADGRATLGVLERLLDDLDAEVALLARTHEPGRCPGHDSHAKLTPVAALMRRQVYTLCGQLSEQERIVRRDQLLFRVPSARARSGRVGREARLAAFSSRIARSASTAN